jgi:tetratricopeptide (TPR) repeat protein
MKNIITGCLVLLLVNSCQKFLDEPSDKKLAIPSKLSDLQAILDHFGSMNNFYPAALEILADNYYVTDADFSSLTSEVHRNYYLWQPNEVADAWTIYAPIKNSNVVLDNLPAIKYSAMETEAWKNIKGSALFFRAHYLFAGAELFGKPYNKATAGTDWGMALRLTADIGVKTTRSTVKETYERIVMDLKEAAGLLPVTPAVKTRPSKPAAYGALAKTYLSMHEYDSAGKYARMTLQLYGDSLLNFNQLSVTATAPIQRFNREVIFHCRSNLFGILNSPRAKIDTILYRSYENNDLRKSIYYRPDATGAVFFKGDYDGAGNNTGYIFGGIVTDEMLLISAECYARRGDVELAMRDLDALLIKRWKTGTYTARSAANAKEALHIVLAERRKELLFRGTRWMDMRRLQLDVENSITPERIINNKTYYLTPQSNNYMLQIPASIIAITGMPQNPK